MEGLIFDFSNLDPILSNQQMENHYNGHYLKYIEKTNKVIQNNNKLQIMFNLIKNKQLDNNNVHNMFFVLSIKNNYYFSYFIYKSYNLL